MKKKQILAFASRVLGVGITFLLSVFLAKALGAGEFGTYSFLLSLAMLLTLPTQSALPIIALRNAAKCKTNTITLSNKNKNLIVFSILYGLGACFFVFLVSELYNKASFDNYLLYILFPLFITIPLSAIYNGICRGSGHLLIGMVPDYVFKPLMTICLVISFYCFFNEIDLYLVIMSTTVSSFVITVFYGLYIKVYASPVGENRNNIDYDFRQIFNLSVISGGQIIFANIDIFMLGVLSASSQVGIYKVALSISALIIFSQTVINQIIQPDLVKSYRDQDFVKLQSIIKKSSILITSIGMSIFIFILLFGQWLIVSFYGDEYKSAFYILIVLSFGQIINMGLGSVGTILNMTENESHAVKPMLQTISANVILGLLLIYFYDVYGAAIAAVVSTLIWNLMLRKEVLKRVGIESSGLILLFKGN